MWLHREPRFQENMYRKHKKDTHPLIQRQNPTRVESERAILRINWNSDMWKCQPKGHISKMFWLREESWWVCESLTIQIPFLFLSSTEDWHLIWRDRKTLTGNMFMAEALLSAPDHFVFAPGIKEDGVCQWHVRFWAIHGGTNAKCRFFSSGSKTLLRCPWFAFSFFFWQQARSKKYHRNFEVSRTQKSHWKEGVGSPSHFLRERPAYKHSHGNLQE